MKTTTQQTAVTQQVTSTAIQGQIIDVLATEVKNYVVANPDIVEGFLNQALQAEVNFLQKNKNAQLYIVLTVCAMLGIVAILIVVYALNGNKLAQQWILGAPAAIVFIMTWISNAFGNHQTTLIPTK